LASGALLFAPSIITQTAVRVHTGNWVKVACIALENRGFESKRNASRRYLELHSRPLKGALVKLAKSVAAAAALFASLAAHAATPAEAIKSFTNHETHCQQLLGGPDHSGDTPAAQYSVAFNEVLRAHGRVAAGDVGIRLKAACGTAIAARAKNVSTATAFNAGQSLGTQK
jgi:hypothetical protein